MYNGIQVKLYLAEVMDYDLEDSIDKSEKKKADKVKIKVSPQMDSWSTDHLPYARPFRFGGGRTESNGQSGVPLKGSMVWVFFSDESRFKYPFYIADGSINTEKLANLFYDEVLDKLDKLGDDSSIIAPSSEYPDVVAFHYGNGICIAYDRNTDKPSITTYHPSGTYSIIDEKGNAGLYVVGDISVKTDKDGNGIELHTKKQNITFKNTDNVSIVVDGKNLELTDGNKHAIKTSVSGMNLTVDGGGKLEIGKIETVINGKLKVKN